MSTYDVSAVKQAASGRWPDIIARLGGVDPAILDGQHHPCPRCGGTDRFRAFADFAQTGGVYCNQCHAQENGDGFSTLQWLQGWDFPGALRKVAEDLGIAASANSKAKSNGHAKQSGKSSGAACTWEKIVAKTVQGLEKDHGVGVQYVKAWRYENGLAVLRFNLPTPAGQKQAKTFRQIHSIPDNSSAWKYGTPKGQIPLYRTTELTQADTSLAVVLAGEKCADAAVGIGLVATTNAGGEKAVSKADWSTLRRFSRIVISTDNDPTGDTCGKQVSVQVRRIAPDAELKIITLPGLPPKGDIVEWIAAGGTREEFLRIVEAAPAVTEKQIVEWAKKTKAATPKVTAPIANAAVIDEKTVVPIPMADLIDEIRTRSGDWPRRVQSALFIHDAEEGLCWLKRPPAVFGWLARRHGIIDWRRSTGCVTKEEVFAEFQRTATQYDAIEELPHEPMIPRHYYTCGSAEPGSGNALERFLDYHTHASDIDRQLHKAIVATPMWGGPPGSRPAGMFTATRGRGRGKSKALQHVASIYGGLVDVSPNEDIELIKKRLLNAEGITRRIAALDNVKSMRFSCAELESLITCHTVSGWLNYVGEASRPNYLTWLITLNGASLSTDLAQRVVEVQLGEPDYSGDWESDVAGFIQTNRDAILGDIIAFLRQPAKRMKEHSRWGAWEAGVLSRVDEPDKCLATVMERRGEADVEKEECEIIEDAFSARLRGLGYDLERDDVFIPVDIATAWHNQAMGEKKRTTSVTRALKQMHDEGRLQSLTYYREGGTGRRGFRWVGEHADSSCRTRMDIRHRLVDRHEDSDEPAFVESANNRDDGGF